MKRFRGLPLLLALLVFLSTTATASSGQVGLYDAIISYGEAVAEFGTATHQYQMDMNMSQQYLDRISLFFSPESQTKINFNTWCQFGNWRFCFPALTSNTSTDQKVAWVCESEEGKPLAYMVATFSVADGNFYGVELNKLHTVQPYIEELLSQEIADADDEESRAALEDDDPTAPPAAYAEGEAPATESSGDAPAEEVTQP